MKKNGNAQLALIAVITCNSLPNKIQASSRLFADTLQLLSSSVLPSISYSLPAPPPNFYFISQLLKQEISIRQHSVNFCRARRGVNFYLMQLFLFSVLFFPSFFSFLTAELNLGSLQFMIQFPICPPGVFSWWAVLCFCSHVFAQQSPSVFMSVSVTLAFPFPILCWLESASEKCITNTYFLL